MLCCYVILYYIILHYIILYIVLNCIVLYCTDILYLGVSKKEVEIFLHFHYHQDMQKF